MNELIKVNFDKEQPTVSARDLHEQLNIGKRFSAWFETNSKGFVEGEDFEGAYLKVQGNQYGGEQGLFEIKESNVQNPDGSVRITKTTKVTGKGQIYFVNQFLKGNTLEKRC